MLECTHEIERRLAEPHRAKFYWKKSVREGHAKMTHWKNIVRENLLEHIKSVAPIKGSFADLLLKVRDPATGGGLSDAQLLPEITALFFAGTDTTGHTGTWTLYLLSQHPEAEQKALDELKAAGLAPTPENPTPRALEYADLGKLVYCQAIVKGKKKKKEEEG
jgi:cytochrome P450